MKIWLVKKYDETELYDYENIKAFSDRKKAEEEFRSVIVETWGQSLEKLREDEMFADDSLGDDYVKVTEGGDSIYVIIDELEISDPTELDIPLADGSHLNVCKGDPLFNEFCVGVYNPSGDYQDLAVIGENYTYDDNDTNPVPIHKEYSVKVYADRDNEDFTNEFIVQQYESDPVVDVNLAIKGQIPKSEFDQVCEHLKKVYPNLIVTGVSEK